MGKLIFPAFGSCLSEVRLSGAGLPAGTASLGPMVPCAGMHPARAGGNALHSELGPATEASHAKSSFHSHSSLRDGVAAFLSCAVLERTVVERSCLVHLFRFINTNNTVVAELDTMRSMHTCNE